MTEKPIDLYADDDALPRGDALSPERDSTRIVTPFGVVVTLAGLLMVAVVAWGIHQNSKGQPDRGEAPDFSLALIGAEDETFTLSEQQGKVVVINFWGSWCGPCEAEAPMLQRTYADYQTRGEPVEFVGIAVKDFESDALEFMDRFGITYPNVMDIGARLEDEYRTQGVPETFVVGPDGNIVEFYYAMPRESELRNTIEEALPG
jgi:cytochrome c biogenesis protein CcmG/thiol:disulfide interchange protein DsbE